MTLLDGYIGIDTLTEQIRKKALRQGFEFNVMVVGSSGLGKSTMINTLFKSKVSRRSPNKEDYVCPKTIEIKSISHVIEEKGIRLKLTVTDTPGFGDHINNNNCWAPVTKYINDQYEKYLNEEISIRRRKSIPDTRVHCCIYFIAPTGHSLRPIDIEAMKRLVKVVNVIPVIAKADSLTLDERDKFKRTIQEELRRHHIEVFPQAQNEDIDEEEEDANKWLRDKMPFAVVGATNSYSVDGKTVFGRKTNFGLIEVENEEHCEFAHLRNMIIRTHLQDLKDVTAQVHYEAYRQSHLETMKSNPPADADSTVIGMMTPTPSPVGTLKSQKSSSSRSSPQASANTTPRSSNHYPAKTTPVMANSAPAKMPPADHLNLVPNMNAKAKVMAHPTKNGGPHHVAEIKM